MQPIPPRGTAELQPKETLGSQEAAWQPCWSARAGRPSLGSSPLPQGPTLLSWPSGGPLVLDSHQLWAFGGFNPCVFGGVSPPFSLLFSRPLPMSITPPIPNPNSPANTAATRDRTLRQTLPALYSLPSAITPVWWAVQYPWCSPPSMPPPHSGPAKTRMIPTTHSQAKMGLSDPQWGPKDKSVCMCGGGR